MIPSQTKLWIALAIWVVVILGLLSWRSMSQLVTFDHNGNLYRASQLENFEAKLFEQLEVFKVTAKKTVIHFESQDCTCQWVATSHIKSVEQLASQHGYENLHINLHSNDPNNLGDYVPVTPAIAVIDEMGAVTYLGPYSTGMYCSAGNGLVERFITETHQPNLGTVIPYDATGCYCINDAV